MKNTNLITKIIKKIFFATMIIGIVFTLIYIFYTSTALLTSDSVITDVIAYQQRINKEIILSHWYYGNELWLFSLSILTLILSFFIKNNLIVRQISVFLTAILFFLLLYQYSKKFIGKKEGIVLIIIFLTGISYSVLDYFYAFNAYLTVVINSMLLLYLYFQCVEKKENKKIWFVLALVFTFLFNMGSLRYFPSVTAPFLVAEFILIVIRNKNNTFKQTVSKEQKSMKKILGILIVAIVALVTFSVITNYYHYEQRAGSTIVSRISGKRVFHDLNAVIKCVNNFFGYDNENNAITFMTGEQYFVNNHRDFPIISFFSFTNLVKILACLIFMIIAPIMLYKNYKRNTKEINFLLVFNTLSWAIMIYMYIFTPVFMYNASELKYFLFNIVLSIILGIYFLYQYVAINNIKSIVVNSFILVYIISNLYTTALTIKDHDSKVMDEKFELVHLLKENNLTFGYGTFWNGLLTNYLSGYEITVAAVEYSYQGVVFPYKWYSDERWYKQGNPGRTFLILDERNKNDFAMHLSKYEKPNKVLTCTGFTVYVYDKNPFLYYMS